MFCKSFFYKSISQWVLVLQGHLFFLLIILCFNDWTILTIIIYKSLVEVHKVSCKFLFLNAWSVKTISIITILWFTVHNFVRLALCPPSINPLDGPHLLYTILLYLFCGWDLIPVFDLIVWRAKNNALDLYVWMLWEFSSSLSWNAHSIKCKVNLLLYPIFCIDFTIRLLFWPTLPLHEVWEILAGWY